MRQARTTAAAAGAGRSASTAAGTPAPSGGRAISSNHHPIFIVAVAVGFLALWVMGIMTQVQTNEAFITAAGQVNVYHPNWLVLWQLPNLLLGNTTAGEGASIMFGWGVELVYLGFVVSSEMLHDAASRSGRTMAGLFKVLSYGIVVFNGWTDYNYGSFGSSSGIGGHLLFAAIMSFIVGFFGTIGMYLLECAWRRS
jgi:hypothetical protein